MAPLAPPSHLPAAAREVLRLWSVKTSPRALHWTARWPDWEPDELGEVLATVAADFLGSGDRQSDPLRLKDESDDLRLGFTSGLTRAQVAHDPPRYDEWGCPFKTRFANVGESANSVLAKDFPELFERLTDDETAIVYFPKFREFGIPVLDGGASVITITHDPFSGKPLPSPLGDAWFDAVERSLGRPYSLGETKVPDEFQSEAWWIARKL